MAIKIEAKGSGGTVSLHDQFVRIDRTGFFGALNRLNTWGQPLEKIEEIPLGKIVEVRLKEAGLFSMGAIQFVCSKESLKAVNFSNVGKIPGSLAFDQTQQSQFEELKKAVENTCSLGKETLWRSEMKAEGQGAIEKFPDNMEKYVELNRSQDWEGICRLNDVFFDDFGTKKEVRFLKEYLEENEIVFALTSGLMKQAGESNQTDFGLNTWLVVLTNERFLFMDAAMLTDSIDIQSIRHNRVQAVSFAQGFMFGKISIDLGSRVVVIDNCPKDSVMSIARIANRWHKHLEDAEAEQKTMSGSSGDGIENLEKLAKLHASGVLTDTEFQDAKAKILGAL